MIYIFLILLFRIFPFNYCPFLYRLSFFVVCLWCICLVIIVSKVEVWWQCLPPSYLCNKGSRSCVGDPDSERRTAFVQLDPKTRTRSSDQKYICNEENSN